MRGNERKSVSLYTSLDLIVLCPQLNDLTLQGEARVRSGMGISTDPTPKNSTI